MSIILVVSAMAFQPGPMVEASAGQIIYEDARDVRVRVAQPNPDIVTVTSTLPPGWSFKLSIDGNQDDKWGLKSGMPDPSKRISPDKTFSQDSRNGAFCSQYIFTTVETDPSQILISSQCGDLPSKGRVIQSGFDSRERVTISFEIPAEEFFGTQTSARVQACVWDTTRMSCQHRMPNLIVIPRQ